MKIENFIKILQEELVNTDINEITPNAEFRQFEDWNSLEIMILTTRLNEDYKLKMSSESIRKSKTVFELYNAIINENNI